MKTLGFLLYRERQELRRYQVCDVSLRPFVFMWRCSLVLSSDVQLFMSSPDSCSSAHLATAKFFQWLDCIISFAFLGVCLLFEHRRVIRFSGAEYQLWLVSTFAINLSRDKCSVRVMCVVLIFTSLHCISF